MNGALGLLLETAGFTVTVVEAAVLRVARGDRQRGNHIALLVDVGGERWLADTGIGDAFLEPLPLREGEHRQGRLTYRLERLDTGTWRTHHDPRERAEFRIPLDDIAPGDLAGLWAETGSQHEAWLAIQKRRPTR